MAIGRPCNIDRKNRCGGGDDDDKKKHIGVGGRVFLFHRMRLGRRGAASNIGRGS